MKNNYECCARDQKQVPFDSDCFDGRSEWLFTSVNKELAKYQALKSQPTDGAPVVHFRVENSCVSTE